uniref:NADH-ubiquinone oxidoreductase chain 2 n=1 Tax=Eisenia nana TaxID=2690238 RepID=A0A6B9ITM5_9ANNE|nr:NADH dehydrogenase subunit 2 [Eisenia nana]
MSLIYSPFLLLTMSTLLLSTVMAMSSTNWILLWGAMELNLLSFIPVMLQTKSHQEVEGSVKYFLAQALGSALLLASSTSMWMPFSLATNYVPLLLTSALLLKLGSVPCHFWYPSVMSSISWTSCLVLSSWQKLAPLSILAFLLPQKHMHLMMVAAAFNALVGGTMGMNQSQLRTIMAYSSIGHIGWMLSLVVVLKPTAAFFYLFVYSALIIPVFMTLGHLNITLMKHLNAAISSNMALLVPLPILLMSLGGLPPLTGFMPKLMTMMMLSNSMMLLMIPLILGSLMNLYFYLNIAINIMFSAPAFKSYFPVKKVIPTNPVIVICIASLGLSPLIMM